MITDMKRDCVESPGWKYIDHDRTMTISQWIEELINHSEESYIIFIRVFDREQDYDFRIRISIDGVSILDNHLTKYCDYFHRKVFCAQWRFAPRSVGANGTMWNILLYI